MANSVLPLKRKQSILHLLESEWDFDGTVQWMLKEFRDDDAIKAAKNKEKLCMNILTLGGTGLNQHVNIVAFQQALAEYADNLRQKDQAQSNARLTEAIKERDRYRDLLADAEARAREATDDARDKERKLNAAERSVLRYELTGAAAA